MNLWNRLRKNFLTRILSAFAVVTFLIIGATNVVILKKEEKALVDHLVEQGNQMASFLAHTTRLGVYTDNPALLDTPMDAVMAQLDVVTVSVFTADGALLFKKGRPGVDRNEADGAQWTPPTFAEPPYTPKVEKGETTFTFWAPVLRESNLVTEEALYVESQQPVQHELIGTVAITVSTKRLNEEDRHIVVGTITVSTLLFAFCAVIFYFILLHYTKPLAKLIKEINALNKAEEKAKKEAVAAEEDQGEEKGEGSGEGEENEGSPEKVVAPFIDVEADDFSVLSDTYFGMVDALRQAFATIHSMKMGLEDKIKERTAELSEVNTTLRDRQAELQRNNEVLNDTLARLRGAQAQLVQSEKMAALGQVVAGVAHEVNNTINFISGALPVLKINIKRLRDIIDTSGNQTTDYRSMVTNTTELIDNMMEGTRRTSDIVRDLQTFARTDGSGLQHFSLHQGLDSTLAILRPEYEKKNITVTRDYHPQLPQITCFASQVNQVFMNVIINAIQALPSGGVIHVTTHPGEGKQVHVIIRDNGPGISPDTMPKIFDPFFTTKEVGKGTGLGLGISYQIVHRHGGTIEARSEPGQGTEFEIVLPHAISKELLEKYQEGKAVDTAFTVI